MFRDPVCGMKVDPATAVATREHAGQTFYFCSQACVDKFDDDPHRYGHGESEVPDDDHGHQGGHHH
jgi:P-type Cu+ transporter